MLRLAGLAAISYLLGRGWWNVCEATFADPKNATFVFYLPVGAYLVYLCLTVIDFLDKNT